MRALGWIAIVAGITVLGCQEEKAPAPAAGAARAAPKHASNLPPLHPTNIVSIASGSADHTTLVAALQYHFDELSGVGGPARPGVVHRLDRDTTGVIVIATVAWDVCPAASRT